MGNNNEAKITIVGDAEQLRGLIRVINTDLDGLGKGPTADPFKPLVDGAQSASEKLKALGISVDRSYAEQRASIKATAAEAVKASEQITAAQLAFNRTRNEFNASVRKGSETDNLLTGGGSTAIKPNAVPALRQLKDEVKGVTEEAEKGRSALGLLIKRVPGVGSVAGGLAGGLLGGAAISEGIRLLTTIAEEELKAYSDAFDSQKRLETASRDQGISLGRQTEAVVTLQKAYSNWSESAVNDFATVGLALTKLRQSEGDIKNRLGLGLENPTGDLRKAIDDRSKVTVQNALTKQLDNLSLAQVDKLAADQAVSKGITGNYQGGLIKDLLASQGLQQSSAAATAEARKKAADEFTAGNTAPLTGLTQEDINARFGREVNKRPSQFTPEDEANARKFILQQLASTPDPEGKLEANRKDLDRQFLTGQLRNDSGDLKTQQIRDDFEKGAAESRAAADALLARQTEKAREAFKDVKSEFNDLAQRIGQGNPFVKFAIDSAQSIEDIKTKFQGFGSDFVAMMLKIEAQTRATELAQLRYNSSLTALKDNQEARRLDRAFIGITGPQTRDLAVVNAQLADLTQGGAFRDRADRLERPFAARPDARREFDKQLRDLLGIDTSGSGRFGREAVSDAVLNLTGKIDPRTLATSGDPVIRAAREAAITANRTKAASFTANLQDEIARRDAGQSIVKDAVEQLNLLQNSGLDRRAGIKEFLATTGALSESELTPDLRRARANALRESAKLESGREDEGFKLQQQQAKDLATIKQALLGAGIKIDPDSVISLNIDLSDGDVEKSHKPSLPQAPKANVTQGGPPAHVPFQQY